jgi:hypothetical protein
MFYFKFVLLTLVTVAMGFLASLGVMFLMSLCSADMMRMLYNHQVISISVGTLLGSTVMVVYGSEARKLGREG